VSILGHNTHKHIFTHLLAPDPHGRITNETNDKTNVIAHKKKSQNEEQKSAENV